MTRERLEQAGQRSGVHERVGWQTREAVTHEVEIHRVHVHADGGGRAAHGVAPGSLGTGRGIARLAVSGAAPAATGTNT